MPDGHPGTRAAQGPAAEANGDGAAASVQKLGQARYNDPNADGWVIETIVSPFHCFYQDALFFHTQSKRAAPRSDGEASRLARAALLSYFAAAEALVHQAAVELGRPELAPLIADPSRPMQLADAWRLLPAILADGPAGPFQPEQPPWPQFAELLALRAAWLYPGAAADRRAYYRSHRKDADYEPLSPHQIPAALNLPSERLAYPRTGLPRDPYALRPHHLDTARGVLDAAIDALDRRLGGALTRDQRHRIEPVRLAHAGL
jgi:hypothetical protein